MRDILEEIAEETKKQVRRDYQKIIGMSSIGIICAAALIGIGIGLKKSNSDKYVSVDI